MKYIRLYPKDRNMILEMLASEHQDLQQDRILGFLSNEHNFFIAAIERNRIVGHVIAYKLQRYDGHNSMMYVHDIDVAEDFRRKGIGRTLLKEMKRICAKESISKMFLVTNASNQAAMAYYASEAGVRKSEDDVVFEFKDFLN